MELQYQADTKISLCTLCRNTGDLQLKVKIDIEKS
jgi:hypothetical protein